MLVNGTQKNLNHSRAYLQVAEEGFIQPSGHLHAPETAVTIELQEASDGFSIMQAIIAATEDLTIRKFFGPDVNPDVLMITRQWKPESQGTSQ